ncbi:MAG: DNA polymerase II [Victivallales bacterium]|nr:DNA polymerase II [Victivallales bacterium]
MAPLPTNLESLVTSVHERLVAVEVEREGELTLFRRLPEGPAEAALLPFEPFLLVSGENLAASVAGSCRIVPLAGDGVHNVRVHFPTAGACRDAAKALRKLTGAASRAPGAPYRVFSDTVQQALSLLPARLFRGMPFADLRRLQLDIETLTTPGYDFPNAAREGDAVCLIALRDSTGWETCLSSADSSEPEILREMVRLIRERDPDVIEGHNLCNFDLPFLEARSKRHRVQLKLGRDGSRIWGRTSRFSAGERMLNYRRYEIYGRHVVDTLHLVQFYDAVHRDLESYGLKNVARHFGVAAPERTYVDGSEISQLFHEDPDRLREYCLDDARETGAIGRLLLPSYFHQAQLVPLSLQNCVVRGNATRIDALLVAEYLQADNSLPTPQASRSFRGGLTAALSTGVFENVWHADVRSLYPSIISSKGLTPRSDPLGAYHSLLAGLRRYRLEAKDAARDATGVDSEHLNALQSSFKILINSFYGYAGFGQGTFNDYELAETVTAEGRRILESMLDFLNASGAEVIEMDTDGIYFVPPNEVDSTQDMADRIQAILPPGIEIDLDATYRAMFGYKSKNYALLGHDDKLSVTGAALKSRGLEPFQRRYIQEVLHLLLHGRGDEIPGRYEECARAIEERTLPVADFAKRENLSTSPAAYAENLAAGKGRRSAAYELALAANREYSQGDQVVFYVTGTKKSVGVADAAKLLSDAPTDARDENVPYYLDKLKKLHAKFVPFL